MLQSLLLNNLSGGSGSCMNDFHLDHFSSILDGFYHDSAAAEACDLGNTSAVLEREREGDR